MVFSSIVFLLFFLPIFLAVYYLTPNKYQNYIVLVASIFFYAWGAPKFVFILLGSVVVTFYLVKWMHLTKQKKKKNIILFLSIFINLGFLIYFKYANFFIENVNDILLQFGMQPYNWVKIALPIGISFYTFQTITYAIDVYRKIHDPLNKLSDYTLYIIMFPQLIAGPIIRYNYIADQLVDRKATYNDRLMGFYRFCIGLSKKVLIANTLGEQADLIMGMDFAAMNSTTAWIGILAYTFQIYFDFSGYSDMAIGIGRMIGFKFPENFDNPYISKSITEFWRRWHITLGAFMKFYLYIPLGGNKVETKRRLYFNLWFVFLISGLWHGASWNFVIWGAYHGFFLVIERLFLSDLLKKLGSGISLVYTFIVTILGWVIFRIEDYQAAFLYYSRLFAFDFDPINFLVNNEFFTVLFIAVFFSFFTLLPKGLTIERKVFYSAYTIKQHYIGFTISIILFLLALSSITTTDFNPFIYFRF
jgi:alginate O-acetyltransferase complex protein AlgI